MKNADISESTLVDNEGNLVYGRQLFVFGKQKAEGKGQSVLAFKRELSVLEKNVAKLSRDVQRSEDAAKAIREKLTEFEEKTVDLQSVIIKVERGLLGMEAQGRSVRQDIERAQRHQEVVAAETKQLEGEKIEIGEKIDAAGAGRMSARKSMGDAEEQVRSITEKLAGVREQSEAENTVLNEKRTLAATSGERRRSVQSALRRVENEKKEVEMRISTLNRESSESEERIESLEKANGVLIQIVAGAAEAEKNEQQELATAQGSVAKGREASDAASIQLADANKRLAETLNDRTAIEVQHAEAVTKLRNVNENCAQELNTALADLMKTEKIDADFMLTEERAKTEDLRQRLDAFGAINMLAVEELAETEERLTFLISQRQDIIDSIESAQEALREIKERSRAKFKEAFEAVNANFVEFFQELFGGGRGEMTLLEAEDILEAGIEIVAQPPGKRLQNILLLSGGEKAMTAIALILAIFRYRPSPFCLLDEVDAPLDEANVGRFVTKISEMSEKTQFIVITHNKRTMEAARALYGVTMQEAGVSKVVSVKFE